MSTHAYHKSSQPCLNEEKREAFEISFFTTITWFTNKFLLENHVKQYENALYSPDLSSCDFLFPKLKKQLRGIRFNDDNEMVTALEQAIDSLTKKDFRRLVYLNALMLRDSTLKKLIKIIL